ncbi:sensor histidine kinase [Clostridium sp. DJ247]|uniref:sensor histidine kinase n=1 Tax=Clostridium sp. DJ247 TaxID=2726188 RepID=UPI001628577F|nr:sensor histidine kinase [Clostridium sp. DJ247]MBC2582468.1 sensor histidine kinase [Clostridium sp. DJ247]
MREDILVLILMMITVPLSGELKIYPFHDTFRVSFGTSTFLFLLLWIKNFPLLLCGFIVGLCVLVFRISIDWFIKGGFQLAPDFILHFSAFFYYISYALFFYLAKINKLHHKPFLLGFLCILIEMLANIVELSFRHYILGTVVSSLILWQVIVIAVIRTFFSLAFFYIIKLYETRQIAEQQQEQNRHMLLLISNLFEESVQLKKSLQNAEDITRDCYNLYQHLQNNQQGLDKDTLAQKMLLIAGQVHEIKKDNQRIYVGLSKLICDKKPIDYMSAEEIVNIIIPANKKYSSSLRKNIKFISSIQENLPNLHVFTVLSLINNLVSNSVEAIEAIGIIKISINTVSEMIEFQVQDNGISIPEKKRKLIFRPGYTTKYDVSGKPSTGMGLPYVKEVVTNLGGNITLVNLPIEDKKSFIIKLPINSLTEKG